MFFQFKNGFNCNAEKSNKKDKIYFVYKNEYYEVILIGYLNNPDCDSSTFIFPDVYLLNTTTQVIYFLTNEFKFDVDEIKIDNHR